MMKRVKITVLKTLWLEDLVKEYGTPAMGRCPFHKEGDVFYGDHRKPEDFCDEAWVAIQHYVFALAHQPSTKNFYYDDAIGWNGKPGVVISSCPDGCRPVIFKLEATDTESVRGDMSTDPPRGEVRR